MREYIKIIGIFMNFIANLSKWDSPSTQLSIKCALLSADLELFDCFTFEMRVEKNGASRRIWTRSKTIICVLNSIMPRILITCFDECENGWMSDGKFIRHQDIKSYLTLYISNSNRKCNQSRFCLKNICGDWSKSRNGRLLLKQLN